MRNDRIRMTRERRSFAFGGSRIGRLHAVRVFFLVLALAGLVWYGKLGNNPFAVTRLVRVAWGAEGGRGVDFLVVTGTSGDTASAADVVRKEVFPLPGNDGATAELAEFAGALIMVCDSAIFAPGSARPLFYERLDLLVIPSADERTVMAVRDSFRPRLLAVAPPCSPSTQNIICADGASASEFVIKNGKLTPLPRQKQFF